MPAIALYYPWMHFQTDSWVKMALLTWNQVARICPPADVNHDSALVKQIRTDSDFVLDIVPGHDAVNEVSGLVVDALRDHKSELESELRSAERMDRFANSPRLREAIIMGLSPDKVWLYDDEPGFHTKVELRAAAQLVAAGLAEAAPPDHEHRLGLDPRLAFVYLSLLAETLASRNQMSLTTDDPEIHCATGSSQRLVDLLRGVGHQLPTADPVALYLHLAVDAAIRPKRLEHVPVSKLIAFRERYADELAAFRDHVQGFSDRLREAVAAEDLAVAQAHLRNVYTHETLPKLKELRRALRGLGIDSALSTMAVKVDVSAIGGTVVASAAVAAGQQALAATAATVTIVPLLIQQRRARKQALTESPVSYLLSADRELNGPQLLRRLR